MADNARGPWVYVQSRTSQNCKALLSSNTKMGKEMAAKNDITGDSIQTRTVSDTYRNNYDLIFRKKTANDDKKDRPDANETVDVEPTQE